MKISHALVLTGAAAAPAGAATLDVTVTIPRLQVAEYHKPYVTMWIEQPGKPGVRNLAVWYDHDMKANEGTKWLKDMREWWRKSGRTLSMPVDGISGATRAPGPQKIVFGPTSKALQGLAAGDYVLVVEAAREVGGREVVRVPFSWGKAGSARGAGTTELGAIALTVKP